MRSQCFYSLVSISLAIYLIGCSSDAPGSVIVSTPLPTPEPTETTIEATEVEVEDTEEIPETGPVRIGINPHSIPPLVIHEEDSISGFEIDLATEIVARLYGSEAVIEWVPITSHERFTSLADDQIDMLVRSLLHTVSREEQALFSGAYLLGGNSFMVFKDDGFSSIEDLDGKNVAVVPQMEEALNQAAGELGYTFNAVIGEDFAETRGLLGFDRADALYNDWLLLASVMDENVHTIISSTLSFAPIGIAFSLDNQALRDEVDVVLMEIISDGTWQSLYDKWIGVPVLWNVEEMFAAPPLEH